MYLHIHFRRACQDMSAAGLGKGMAKGSGTRSGMLWEVERILDELAAEKKELPQVLLMENVPQVIGANNKDSFALWTQKLAKLGYNSFFKVLNAWDYVIPQNRERCFMVSILGDYYYEFPKEIPLEYKLKDLLEKEVDEKYYLSDRYKYISTEALNTDKLRDVLYKKVLEDETTQEFDVIGTNYTSLRVSGEKPIKLQNNKSPTLTTSCGDELAVVVENTYAGTFDYRSSDDFLGNRERFHPDSEISSTIRTTVCDGVVEKSLIRKDLCNKLIDDGIVKEGDVIRHSYANSRIDDFHIENSKNHDCCATLTTRADTLGIVVKTDNKRLNQIVNKMDLSKDNQFVDAYNQTTSENAETITTRIDDANHFVYADYRIRKLTPKECFRLMGIKDKDFENIAQNQSDASLWHLAGDSIVAIVLMAIFGEMLNIDWKEKFSKEEWWKE